MNGTCDYTDNPYNKPMNIIRPKAYQRAVRRILSAEQQIEAEDMIAADPRRWPVISGSGGIRKARVRASGRGKSGGGRLIYYYASQAGEIYMLWAYAKAERDDVTAAEIKTFRRLIGAIEESHR